MTDIFVGISGPGTVDDLTNGGREAVARAGYEVGDFQLEQDLTDQEQPSICGNLEVDDRLWRKLRRQGGVTLEWGEYKVEAEMP